MITRTRWLVVVLLCLWGALSAAPSQTPPGGADQKTVVPRYELIWQTPAVFRTPEAVLYDNERDVLYVSNFNTDGGFLAGRNEPRHREFISKIDTAGNVLTLKWATGLEAPTGMAIHNGKLFVVERANLVEIDIESTRIVGRWAISGASFANDVAMDANGTGYISDNDRQALVGIGLANRQVRTVAKSPSDAGGVGDGLVRISERTYLVTAWAGSSWLVRPDGSVTALLDTNQFKPVSGERVNNADSGFVPGKNLWVISAFMDHRLLAYELKTSGN